MSPGQTAFTIWCIAGSSVGALALFRARMARRAVSLRKLLALLARSCWAAACASCASPTVSATRLRTVASCTRRRALACSGPFPLSARHGDAGSARRGVGRGSGRKYERQVRDGHGVPQVHVDPEAGSDPRGHLWVTWGVYLCAGKAPLADIILSHPPDLT